MNSAPTPGARLDRFVVERELGVGASGRVLLVRHHSLGSLHALKLLTPEPAARERLLREGRLQAGLRHPNVVAVTDVLELGERLALVMEYVEGPTLRELLARESPGLVQAEALFADIVAGVAHAHGLGIVHRDLKPANVLLQRVGERLLAKVADFGLAKTLSPGTEPSRTRTGQLMGTPAYMAPEQYRDAKGADARADLFSLGCILYELCCGRPAFEGRDLIALFESISRGDFVAPRQLEPQLPERIDQAIRGCLIADRSQRIPDCATLLAVMVGERGFEPTPVTGPAAETISWEDEREVVSSACPADPSQPRLRRLALVLLAVMFAGAIGAMALLWGPPEDTDELSSPAPLPLTVLLYDHARGPGTALPEWGDRGAHRRYLGEQLLPAILEQQPRAVVLDLSFESVLAEDSAPLAQALVRARRQGIPVAAVAPLRQGSAVPPCDAETAPEAPCFAALWSARAPTRTPDTDLGVPVYSAWPWCSGGRPALGVGVAGLMGGTGVDMGCRAGDILLHLLPEEPCSWPFSVLSVSSVLGDVPAPQLDARTGQAPASCPSWDSSLRDRVVLVGDPWLADQQQDAVVLQDASSGRRVRASGVEVHAIVGWNLLMDSADSTDKP